MLSHAYTTQRDRRHLVVILTLGGTCYQGLWRTLARTPIPYPIPYPTLAAIRKLTLTLAAIRKPALTLAAIRKLALTLTHS